MKILIAADIHGRRSALEKIREKAKKEKVELVLVAGDLTIFERELEEVLESLDGVGVPVLIVPGNHEDVEALREACAGRKHLVFLHEATYELEDCMIVGYGNPGFSLIDSEFERFAKKIGKAISGKKVILLHHGPPFKTKLDLLDGEHVGNKSISKFIEEHDNVLLAVSGHLHENFGVEDKLNKARLVNPGPMGKIIDI